MHIFIRFVCPEEKYKVSNLFLSARIFFKYILESLLQDIIKI